MFDNIPLSPAQMLEVYTVDEILEIFRDWYHEIEERVRETELEEDDELLRLFGDVTFEFFEFVVTLKLGTK